MVRILFVPAQPSLLKLIKRNSMLVAKLAYALHGFYTGSSLLRLPPINRRKRNPKFFSKSILRQKCFLPDYLNLTSKIHPKTPLLFGIAKL